MFKCYQCGFVAPTEKVRFCGNCGAANVDPDSVDPLADKLKDWASEHIDQPQMVSQYVSMLAEFYFESPKSAEVMKYSVRIRERLKISFETHKNILEKLEAKKKAIAHLANFRFEFNENVVDAYAGHDTFLNFRYTNQTEDDLFKVALFWDDPDTERIDLKAETKSLVKPMTSVTLGASAIFDRIGMKELSDFQITITDQFGEAATFRAEPFSFKVANHDQRITQNISTHNQISIEGRVIDATGIGSGEYSSTSAQNSDPIWKNLACRYVYSDILDTVINQEINDKINNSDVLSLTLLAEKGDPTAQHRLGKTYRAGTNITKSLDSAIHWFKKAADQGHPDSLNSLGWHYQYVEGLPQNHEKAFALFKKAYSAGYEPASLNIALCYERGQGVDKDESKARSMIEMAAESGDANAQNLLGKYWSSGKGGLDRSYEKAFYWYKKAAEGGSQAGFWNMGVCYHRGQGTTKNIQSAMEWYLKCAETGDRFSYERLADILTDGKELPVDQAMAKYYLEKAIELGSESARVKINEFNV